MAWYSERCCEGGTAHFWRVRMKRCARRCRRVDMARLNEKEALEGPRGEETASKKEDAFWEREGMKDYGSTVDAAGCEKFWVSVGLESPNDIYHSARVLGRWNVLEGWHSALGRGDGAGRCWMGETTRVGVLG
jgi:hypothetical protein